MQQPNRQLRMYCWPVFVLFLIVPWTVLAATTNWYQVNLIIFTRLAKTYYESEKWTKPTALPDKPPWQRLSTWENANQDSIPTIHAFEELPHSQFQLSREATRLKNSRNYHIIFASSWIQPVSFKKTKPVFFKGGESFETPTLPESDLLGDENDQHQMIPQIQGLITFKETNYIQVNANLRLTEPVEALPSQGFSFFSNEVDRYQTFALDQTQRLRPDEIHYFDHPLFGMIIKLTPYAPSIDTLQSQSILKPVSLNTENTTYQIRP